MCIKCRKELTSSVESIQYRQKCLTIVCTLLRKWMHSVHVFITRLSFRKSKLIAIADSSNVASQMWDQVRVRGGPIVQNFCGSRRRECDREVIQREWYSAVYSVQYNSIKCECSVVCSMQYIHIQVCMYNAHSGADSWCNVSVHIYRRRGEYRFIYLLTCNWCMHTINLKVYSLPQFRGRLVILFEIPIRVICYTR